MLDLIERIVHGICIIIVLLVCVLYLWIGVPSTLPPEFVPRVQEQEVPIGPTANASSLPPRIQEIRKNTNDEEIRGKLREQGVRISSGVPIRKKSLVVPAATFEILQTEANWKKYLKEASSIRLKGPRGETRLKIDRIREDSLLRKMGIQEGDIVELIDGEIVEFNEYSTLRYRSMFKGAIEKLRSGGTVSVTVTRNRQPVHLVFSL